MHAVLPLSPPFARAQGELVLLELGVLQLCLGRFIASGELHYGRGNMTHFSTPTPSRNFSPCLSPTNNISGSLSGTGQSFEIN
jgi:hypothetical protein